MICRNERAFTCINMNLNTRCGKEYLETQNFDFFGKQNRDFFSDSKLLQRFGLFSCLNVLTALLIFLFSVDVP